MTPLDEFIEQLQTFLAGALAMVLLALAICAVAALMAVL